jgi:4-hydroxy-2-oxoheptanedioate aldolase
MLSRRFSSSRDIRKNSLKFALNDKNRPKQIGLWTGLKSSLIAEMLATTSGFDWFVIDMEHSPNDISDVLIQLQVSQHGSVEPIVRVPWNDPVMVKRVLDMGAQTILFPVINNANEARLAVSSMRYPPLGIRGVMSLQRMNLYGAYGPQYYQNAHTQLCCVCQIETVEALNNIEEIAAVEGVDALFLGPSDLSASLGYIGQPKAPVVRAALADGFKRIHAAGKASGFLSGDRTECEWALEQGASMVGVGSDIALLANTSRALATHFKSYHSKKNET